MIGGITLFLIMVVIYFTFINNLSSGGADFSSLYDETIILSDTLLSAGSPANWTANSVDEIGVTDGKYRLMQSKWRNLSTMDYSKQKLLLKTKYDYLIFFENKDENVLNINGTEYAGFSGLNKDTVKNQKYEELISIKRLLIYNNTIITMVVYSWG